MWSHVGCCQFFATLHAWYSLPVVACTFAWPPVLYTDQPNCPLRLYCPLLAFPARCLPLFLPAVCPCWAVYRCGWRLSIAAALVGVLVHLNLRVGTARTFLPACDPAAALNLAASVIICVFFCGFFGGFLFSQSGLFGGLLCLVAGLCHGLLRGPSDSNGCLGTFGQFG